MTLRVGSLVLFLFILPLSLEANDAAVAMGVGGLRPQKNAHIEMESEILTIEPDKITVEYVFHNTSKSDETIHIAFPLPDIEVAEIEALITSLRSTESKDPQKLVDFKVEVDGKPIAFETEQKAWLGKKRVDPLLAKWRLPLIPWFPEPDPYEEALRRLTLKQKNEIVKERLVAPDSLKKEYSDSGRGREWSPQFLYRITTQYYWKQLFPKEGRTRIRHTYVPLKGGGYGPAPTEEGSWKEEARMMDEIGFCGSQSDFFKNPPSLKADPQPCGSREEIKYLLTTAKTWKGPIGSFQLKLSGMRYLFTCFKKIKRTGTTSWEFSEKNFVPSQELEIAFCR